MFLVGLTGGIATGKSTVSGQLSLLGCPVIDADLVARQVVEPGTSGWKKIRQTFGAEVFHDDGKLNREKLGEIIFSDGDKRRQLNSITHPEIYKSMMWQVLLYFLKGYRYVILDLPLLFESGKMVPYMTEIVVVSCDENKQLERLMLRNGFTAEEAQQRISSQMSLKEKIKKATIVIDNSGEFDSTKSQIIDLYNKLEMSRAHWRVRLPLLAIGATLSWIIYSAVLWLT